MPLWVFPTAFAAATIVTMLAGIWLLLHLTSLARTFAGTADVVPSPKRPQETRTKVHIVLGAFCAGLLLTLALQVVAITGVANAWLS